MERIVEICTGSYQDCINAHNAGSKRVELNSALALGGLTPCISILKRVKKDTDLEVICMVRNRAGGFCYDEIEYSLMLEDARILLENGADGIAFGALKDDCSVDIEKIKVMVDLIHSYSKTAVFHRAFDVIEDVDQGIKDLLECNVDRILTSGQRKSAYLGIDTIRYLQNKYGNEIEILAGCGINENNVEEIIRKTGVNQVHSSCKGYKVDTTTKGKDVSYSYLSHPYEMCFDVVEFVKVKELIDRVKSM